MKANRLCVALNSRLESNKEEEENQVEHGDLRARFRSEIWSKCNKLIVRHGAVVQGSGFRVQGVACRVQTRVSLS